MKPALVRTPSARRVSASSATSSTCSVDPHAERQARCAQRAAETPVIDATLAFGQRRTTDAGPQRRLERARFVGVEISRRTSTPLKGEDRFAQAAFAGIVVRCLKYAVQPQTRVDAAPARNAGHEGWIPVQRVGAERFEVWARHPDRCTERAFRRRPTMHHAPLRRPRAPARPRRARRVRTRSRGRSSPRR